MKMITAIVQPFMLSKITHLLEQIPAFPGMTVSDARGFGREKHGEPTQPHRRAEDLVEYVPKTRIEIVARDEMVQQIVDTIKGAAHTGNRGDGKIFVWPIGQAVRIKTGESGDDAV